MHFRSVETSIEKLILVTNENYVPIKWPLARIIEVHSGSDGLAEKRENHKTTNYDSVSTAN